MAMLLLPGTEVHARGLRWEVVATDSLGQETLYRLRCLDGPLRGHELDLLTPFETIEPLIRELRPDRAAPLRNWLVYHQAFLLEQALGPDALLAVQPGRLRLEPYQLVPVLRALRISRVRLLLADGVGLGKTIQAGLVLTELIARRLAHRILVVAPAGPLLEQWQTEMSDRFGLRMQLIDRASLETIRRNTELGANPFDHIPLGLASLDFLKQERVLEQLERASYDVIVIDEAHHCMDLGAAGEREDSQRRRLAEVLARRCDALLLLTATPHDGNDRSFASLCELLDPSLVNGHGALRGERYRQHVVRRLKRHIVDPLTKQPRFRERMVTPRPVVPTSTDHAAFVELQRRLMELIAPELRRAFRARRYNDVLAFFALLKRSVSTAAACHATVTVVADRFQQLMKGEAESQESRHQRRRSLQEYQRRLARFGAISADEEREHEALQAEDLAQQLAELQRSIRSGAREQARTANLIERLHELLELAEEAQRHDPKLQALVMEIVAIRDQEPGANVLVYTEYTDSQEAAVEALQRAHVGTVLTMSGEDSSSNRSAVTDRFRTEQNIVLVSTDAAAEGLNLHQRCHHLIHLELPFNPNRLEQRNGRIDRFGQQYDPMVRYLYLRQTFEERILLRLIAKYERQRSRLTFVPNTLGLTASTEMMMRRLLQGLMDDDDRLFQNEPEPVDFTAAAETADLDPATKELLEEVDRSLKGFEQATRTYAWLGDMGLQADEQTVADADRARMLGTTASGVDLAQFVYDAIQLDGGDIRPSTDPEIVEVMLPPAWRHGLDSLPGYDADTRCVRLTTNPEIIHDAWGRSMGYLGRAHPLVRRALDRVRNLSFGGTAQVTQDLRASVVVADIPVPMLLFTFLGRVSSQAGRELEQVLAVQVTADGAVSGLTIGGNWLSLADPKRAIKTTGMYERHFQSWFTDARERATTTAITGFSPNAETFIKERSHELEAERARQEEWLRQRANEITPMPQISTVQQLDLFADLTVNIDHSISRPTWQNSTDPVERLAAFAVDTTQPSRLRGEADGVLRIYRQRLAILAARLDLRSPEILPLGVLMIVPNQP